MRRDLCGEDCREAVESLGIPRWLQGSIHGERGAHSIRRTLKLVKQNEMEILCPLSLPHLKHWKWQIVTVTLMMIVAKMIFNHVAFLSVLNQYPISQFLLGWTGTLRSLFPFRGSLLRKENSFRSGSRYLSLNMIVSSAHWCRRRMKRQLCQNNEFSCLVSIIIKA